MKHFRQLTLVALLLCSAAPLGAQNQQGRTAVNTENNKAVKRITFDRERVTIHYADGTQDDDVRQAVIRHDRATGIGHVKSSDGQQQSAGTYTLDGRKVSGSKAPRGIYIEKRDGQVRKTIKK